MSDGGAERSWTDAEGTEWSLSREAGRTESDATVATEPRIAFRSLSYAFRVRGVDRGLDELDEDEIRGFLDQHRSGASEGLDTARLWRDPRSGVEWEVFTDAGELVFRRGTEAVRVRWEDGRPAPPAMTEEQLVEALDEAQASD